QFHRHGAPAGGGDVQLSPAQRDAPARGCLRGVAIGGEARGGAPRPPPGGGGSPPLLPRRPPSPRQPGKNSPRGRRGPPRRRPPPVLTAGQEAAPVSLSA